MTDTIDTLNDEINGGANMLNKIKSASKNFSSSNITDALKTVTPGKRAKQMLNNITPGERAKQMLNNITPGERVGNMMAKTGQYGKEFGKFAYQNSDFYVVLFTLNFILRSSLVLSSPLFKGKKYYIGQYKKHVKESFGVTVILTIIFAYMYSTIDKDTLRGKDNNCIQFTIFTLILFSIFMYDYVNIVLMLVKKKFFSKDKRNQGFLSGIMVTIIVGIVALYYMTVVLSKGMPINLSGHLYPFLLGCVFLLLLSTLSILGFFIIYPNIKEIQKSHLSNNNNDRKEFFIDMFKKYYMVFILISCILLVVLKLNEDEFYDFVNRKFPCPKPKVSE